MSSKEPILFMFLEDIPLLNSRQDQHWEKFLTTIDDSFYVVVHPKDITDVTKNNILSIPEYNNLYINEKLHIVSSEYHVKTAWASFSLVSAVLLMMEYMLMKKGNIFKKYILISSQDYPLYNYKVLYNELVSDNKSWLYYNGENSNGGYANTHFKKIYNFEGGIFNINDITYVSQWCAIDRNHIKFFFNDETLKSSSRTYIKKNSIIRCKNVDTEIVESLNDDIYQKYINSHIGTYKNFMTETDLEDLNKTGFCINANETFFGAIIKVNFKKNMDKLLENIRYYNISKLEKYNKIKYIQYNPIEDLYNNYVFMNNLSRSKTTSNLRTWYGSQFGFNLNDKKERYNFIGDQIPIDISNNIMYRDQAHADNPDYFYIRDNDIIKTPRNTLKGLQREEYNDNSKTGKRNVKERYKDIYTISTTYTDWSIINPSPRNMFRNIMNTKQFNPDNTTPYLNDNFIKAIEELSPDDLLTELLRNPCISKGGYISLFVTKPDNHPIEYELYLLQELINAYNIIEFFQFDKKYINGDTFYENYRHAKQIYQNTIDNINNNRIPINDINGILIDTTNIILEHIIIKSNTNNHICDYKFYVFDNTRNLQNIEDYLIGYPITSRILNNALNYGGLFIRTVVKYFSNIEYYTDELFSLKEYVHNYHNEKNMNNSSNIVIDKLYIHSNNYILILKSFEPKFLLDYDNIVIPNKKIIQDIYKNKITDIFIKSFNTNKKKEIIAELDKNNIICIKKSYQKSHNDKINFLLIYFADYNENFKYIEKYIGFAGYILMFCDRGNSWYSNMNDIIEYVKNFIENTGVTQIIIIGQFMGGHAALHLSTKINNALCLAFRPVTLYVQNIINGINIPSTLLDIRELITNSRTNSRRYIYHGENDNDENFANVLNGLNNTECVPIILNISGIKASKQNIEKNIIKYLDIDQLYRLIYNNTINGYYDQFSLIFFNTPVEYQKKYLKYKKKYIELKKISNIKNI
jgi:hypothetical protein